MQSRQHVMLRYTIMATVIALASTMTTIAQQRPDFSGEWQLNRQASMLSPAVASVAQTGTLRIEHKEPNFRCHMTIVFDGKPVDTRYEMLADGRETVATTQGRRTVSSLRWDRDALVATSRVEILSGEITVAFRYELHDGGHRLRVSEHLRGAGRDQDNVWVFERP